MKDCRRIDAQLTPYVDKVLDPKDSEDVERHLGTCPPCRVAAEEEQGARTVLNERAEQLRKGTPVPPDLRTRCEALARAHVLPTRAPWWRTRLVPVSIGAVLLIFVGSAAFSVATHRSDGVLAAQLTADHAKCFRLWMPSGAAPIDAASVEHMLADRYGWNIHVPPSSAADGVELVGARRCLYADGRVPHVMYRVNGQDVSLYVLDGVKRDAPDVASLGHHARIWSRGERTYVLVLPGQDEPLARGIRYVMQQAE